MEMLFEQDNEEKSVATLILDCLVKVRGRSLEGLCIQTRGLASAC